MSYTDDRLNKVVPYLVAASKGWAEGPISYQVGLTHACVNHCVMCQHWQRPKGDAKGASLAPTAAMRSVLREMRTMGAESVCFSGGEPMLHPDVWSFIGEALPMQVGIITGGVGVAFKNPDLDLLRKCAWVRVSLDAVDGETYYASRGPGFIDAIANTTLMAESQVPLGFGITVHKLNADKLEDVLRFILYLKQNGALLESVRLWLVRGEAELSITDAQADRLSQRVLPMLWSLEIKHVPTNAVELTQRLSVSKTKPELPENAADLRCVVPLVHLYIDAQLRVFPCCIHAGDAEIEPPAPPIADLKMVTLQQVWDMIRIAEKRRERDYGKHPACAGCTLRLYTINKGFADAKAAGLLSPHFL